MVPNWEWGRIACNIGICATNMNEKWPNGKGENWPEKRHVFALNNGDNF
jgi:hypothetical protein